MGVLWHITSRLSQHGPQWSRVAPSTLKTFHLCIQQLRGDIQVLTPWLMKDWKIWDFCFRILWDGICWTPSLPVSSQKPPSQLTFLGKQKFHFIGETHPRTNFLLLTIHEKEVWSFSQVCGFGPYGTRLVFTENVNWGSKFESTAKIRRIWAGDERSSSRELSVSTIVIYA